jgi:peptidoglycan hydrolase CwlO-like protein
VNDTLSAPSVKFEWKVPVVLVLINLIGIAIQWGVISAKLDELFRDKEAQERHLEYIDNELKERDGEAGEVREFRAETKDRFDKLDRKIEALEGRPR